MTKDALDVAWRDISDLNTDERYQVLSALTPDERGLLKTLILQHGVSTPIDIDEQDRILDGHHRVEICRELGIERIQVIVRHDLTTDDQKIDFAKMVNYARRHAKKDDRDSFMRELRAKGRTLQQIADVTGVSYGTVHKTVADVQFIKTDKLTGKDGKHYPPTKKRQTTPKIEIEPEPAVRQPRAQREPEPAAPTLPDAVAIHHADARELASLVEEPVHLVITSPPYNVGIDYATHDDNLSDDDYHDLLYDVFGQCWQVMEDGARIAVVVPFGVGRNPWTPVPPIVYSLLKATGFTLRGQIVWDKNTTGNRTSWGSFRLPSNPAIRDTTEAIIVAHKGDGNLVAPDTIRGVDGKGTYTAPLADSDYFMELAQDHWVVAPESARRVGHPAPFPVELAKRLIDFYAYPGAHILDPFGGSGTTAIAAMKAGCRATLVEIDGEYCRLAKGRLTQ